VVRTPRLARLSHSSSHIGTSVQISLDDLRALDTQALAKFASPVVTEGWSGRALFRLLFHDGKLAPLDDCVRLITTKFKASEANASDLYDKLATVGSATTTAAQGLCLPRLSLLSSAVGQF
jgi:hypothetical protein